MTNKATEFIILRNGGGANTASFTATTTTTSESVSLNFIGVLAGKECEIDWGDGTVQALTGTATRSHTYTDAGDYTIRISSPENLETIDIRSDKITLNSADIKNAVNVDLLILIGLKSGTFDSADVSSWSPSFFQLRSMPAGYTGTFNSSDVASWSPETFRLASMPAGYTGTFNSSDVASWSPSIFRLFSMPADYTGTFNSSDVASWSPSIFLLSSMPAGYGFTINSGAFSNFTTTSNFQIQDNGLTQAQCDNALLGLYDASKTRTVSGGIISVGGTNAAPSGTFAAQCPPTGGKNAAYELLNDSCGALTNVWDTVTFTA